MPTLINNDYFLGDILLPGASVSVPGGGHSANAVCRAIDEYEPEFLIKLMGYSFYKLLLAAISVDPEPTSGRWYDIVYGCDFTNHCGVLERWIGLKNPTNKTSLIADYVYYWFIRNQVTNTASIGEVKAKSENSVTASSVNKQVRAWNRIARQMHSFYGLMESKVDDDKVYPEFTFKGINRCYFRPINAFGI